MRKLVLKIAVFALLISILFLLSRTLVRKETQSQKIPQKVRDGNIVLAAGDIGYCGYKEGNATGTAKLLNEFPKAPILTLGDNVQIDGSKEEFRTCFDPTWGKYKNRIFPSVGNHEYRTIDAKPYYEYFGKKAGDPGKGYYSFNLGNWHLIAVNTEFMDRCAPWKNIITKCNENLEQMEWLKKDLEQNKNDCTLVYGHHPLFSSGVTKSTLAVFPMWELLYSNNVDVVLAGHSHDYERFSLQDPQGKPNLKHGIREFVVGTGGIELGGYIIAKNTEVVTNRVHGILKLVLGKGEYEWEFISTDGSFVDKGKSACH